MASPPQPRLCHLYKWTHFDGYGFNLYAEKNKPGQYVGSIDVGSPAEAAGLKEGDRIVEVNGVNVNMENHRQVVQRIKAVVEETRLLVVDRECERWHRERRVLVKPGLSYVLQLTSGPGPLESASPPTQPSSSPTTEPTSLSTIQPTTLPTTSSPSPPSASPHTSRCTSVCSLPSTPVDQYKTEINISVTFCDEGTDSDSGQPEVDEVKEMVKEELEEKVEEVMETVSDAVVNSKTATTDETNLKEGNKVRSDEAKQEAVTETTKTVFDDGDETDAYAAFFTKSASQQLGGGRMTSEEEDGEGAPPAGGVLVSTPSPGDPVPEVAAIAGVDQVDVATESRTKEDEDGAEVAEDGAEVAEDGAEVAEVDSEGPNVGDREANYSTDYSGGWLAGSHLASSAAGEAPADPAEEELSAEAEEQALPAEELVAEVEEEEKEEEEAGPPSPAPGWLAGSHLPLPPTSSPPPTQAPPSPSPTSSSSTSIPASSSPPPSPTSKQGLDSRGSSPLDPSSPLAGLAMTAREMKDLLVSRRKKDPRMDDRMDFRRKHEIIQTL